MALDNSYTPDGERANIDAVIAFAYYMGQEMATRTISDKYTAILLEQRKRATSCRYSNMANKIIGNTQFIYSINYAGEYTETFGLDKTDV